MIDTKSSLSKIFYWCFFGYLGILPLAHTIALRNIFILILIFCIVYAIADGRFFMSGMSDLRKVPFPLVLWLVFLIFFPLWAEQKYTALINLKGQWVQYIFAWCIGMGAIHILRQQGPGLWVLAIASSLPIVFHIFLTLLVWLGLFGSNVVSDISIEEIWSVVRHIFDSSSPVVINSPGFPWGFRGYDPMHGNLGYAACQAIVLFFVCADTCWRNSEKFKLLLAISGITICFLSVLIASSRGAVYFALIMLMVAFFTIYFRNKYSKNVIERLVSKDLLRTTLIVMLASLLLVTVFVSKIAENDARWRGGFDKISIGFNVENPTDILCNGLSLRDQMKIREEYAGHASEYSDELISSFNSDVGRVILMRAGFSLVLENLHGIDGSRSTYERLIEKKCGHPPAMHFAHTHQAWMDLILALGLMGAVALAWVFVNFMLKGWRGTMCDSSNAWAFALFLLSFFWIFRGLIDSVYREHYLQMQALLLSYLYFRNIYSSKFDR